MNLDDAEQHLVDRLATPKVSVDKLPTAAKLNAPRSAAEPQIYVAVGGCDIARPNMLNVYSQEETIRAHVFIQARSRGGEFGVFALYDMVCDRLLGHKLPGAMTPIIFEKFEAVEGSPNEWRYAVTLSFTAHRVEKRPPEEGYGFMKKITNNIEVKI